MHLKITGIVTAILTGVFLFAGCSIPDDVTYTGKETIPQIAAPRNVKATVYPWGAIHVTWDPVKDAKSYDVYRRADVGGNSPNYSSDHLGTVTAGENPSYPDIVGFDNQLQNNGWYIYTIVANSGQSTNKRTISENDVVLNSSARSPRVQAKVPARGSTLDTPDVTLEYYANINNTEGTFLATWTNVPGIVYNVNYAYTAYPGMTGSIAYTTATSGSTGAASLLYPIGYYRFPRLGSGSELARIEVQATFSTDYYLPSATATPAIPSSVPSLVPVYNANLNFNASVVQDRNESIQTYGPYVVATWDKQVDAASYTLYKAEVSSTNAALTNWAPVSITPEDFMYSNKEMLRIIDTTVEIGKRYGYLLVATGTNNGQTVSGNPQYLTIVYHGTVNEIETFRRKAVPDFAFTALVDGNGVIAGIQVGWDAIDDDLDVVYNLYRAPVTLRNPPTLAGFGTDNIDKLDSGWGSPIANINKNSDSFRRNPSGNRNYQVFHVDTDAKTPRQTYAYKVEASKVIDGVTVQAIPKIKVLDQAPYVPYSELYVRYASNQNASYYPAHSIILEISSNGYIRDIAGDANSHVQIWRRTPGTNFVRIGTLALSGRAIADGNTTGGYYYEYTDTFTNSDTSYEYKAIMVVAGREVPNINNSNITTWITPNGAAADYRSWNFSFIPSRPTGRLITVSTSSSRWDGQSIRFRLEGSANSQPTGAVDANAGWGSISFARAQTSDGKLDSRVEGTISVSAAVAPAGSTTWVTVYYGINPIPTDGPDRDINSTLVSVIDTN